MSRAVVGRASAPTLLFRIAAVQAKNVDAEAPSTSTVDGRSIATHVQRVASRGASPRSSASSRRSSSASRCSSLRNNGAALANCALAASRSPRAHSDSAYGTRALAVRIGFSPLRRALCATTCSQPATAPAQSPRRCASSARRAGIRASSKALYSPLPRSMASSPAAASSRRSRLSCHSIRPRSAVSTPGRSSA
ncbi:DUF6053 domain-containing protein [Lysobacter enzymogenes]|uniref:DUF6053 domain-containing protein n=1 Tax=Lysobacter enzymogenes TaxID=69 RepID=UPI003D18801A